VGKIGRINGRTRKVAKLSCRRFGGTGKGSDIRSLGGKGGDSFLRGTKGEKKSSRPSLWSEGEENACTFGKLRGLKEQGVKKRGRCQKKCKKGKTWQRYEILHMVKKGEKKRGTLICPVLKQRKEENGARRKKPERGWGGGENPFQKKKEASAYCGRGENREGEEKSLAFRSGEERVPNQVR